jgi:hypothetical protein
MKHDPALLRLGRCAPRRDPRTLKLARYIPKLPGHPPAKNWGISVPAWGMMANDVLGDCTCASAGHIIMLHTAARGAPVKVADEDVIAAYSAIGGYKPGDPSTDNGAVELDALNYWRKTGIASMRAFSCRSAPRIRKSGI